MSDSITDQYLIYVRLIGENKDGNYEYELFFSETPEIVWAIDWAEQCPAAIGDMPPEEKAVSMVKRVISPYKLNCAQDNFCFSMQDCIDGIISLCWCFDENDKLLFKFKFAEKYEDVEDRFKTLKLTID